MGEEEIDYRDNIMQSAEWRYKYEFDDKNNWIKKTEYRNNKPTYLFERIIEYYE